MASQVDICNQALGACGISKFIQSITENSVEAIVCRQFYNQALGECLEDFPWNFADSYVQLQDIGNPPIGWLYRYQYPNDCQKARGIMMQPGTVTYTRDWSEYPTFKRFAVVENETGGGKAILANIPSPILHYTKAISNPTLFTAQFTGALALLLATKIAAPLAAEPKFAESAANGYRQMVDKAGASMLNEGNTQCVQESQFLKARE